tara:strand:+ start:404 stop:640 length:237 start_codon:yes stop_codon:yes gene_type:complete
MPAEKFGEIRKKSPIGLDKSRVFCYNTRSQETTQPKETTMETIINSIKAQIEFLSANGGVDSREQIEFYREWLKEIEN